MIFLNFSDFLSLDGLLVSGELYLNKVLDFEYLSLSISISTTVCLLLWELLPAGCYGQLKIDSPYIFQRTTVVVAVRQVFISVIVTSTTNNIS